jgi:enoyl-CoA hydratase/carnithine racemase
VTESPVLFDKTPSGIAWITLNRPAVLNAVNLEVRDLLWSFMSAVSDDPEVRVAVFQGAGDRAFSAGADISEFGTAPSIAAARRARRERDVWGMMVRVTKPLVAAIHGFAYGAGCELSMFCDIRIAAGDARFALPEVTLGYVPSAGGTQTLPRTIPPGLAREMIYSGAPISAERALVAGLVHRVVPRARLREEAEAIARTLAAMPPVALRAAKEALLRGDGLPLESALALERAIAVRAAGERAR